MTPHCNRPFSQAEIAALLADLGNDFVFLETAKISPDNSTSLLFSKPVEYLQCRAADDSNAFLAKCQEKLDQGFYLAGWFAYEFGLGLEARLRRLQPRADTIVAELGVYGRPTIFDHQTGQWNRPVELQPVASPQPGRISNIRLSQNQSDYEENIARIKSYIAAGDTYQVNYTLKLLFDYSGSTDALYMQLRRNQLVSYSAYLGRGQRRILSFSPELFFRKQGTCCMVRPMKGTSRRGRSLQEDAELATALHNDRKNRAENVMIVDLLRNDLGRLATMGSVTVTSLFDVETYESLLQMTSTIRGETPDHLALSDLFAALFPCGSVTGAPKIRTMEIIHELENGPRGVYTGAIGYLAPNGDAQFNVPIRTVVLDRGRAEMGIGSGIVADSEPGNEWRECCLKADFLRKPRHDFQLIETLLWVPDEGYWLLAYHLDRLQASASYFGYAMQRQELHDRLAAYADDMFAGEHYRVRLLMDRQGEITLSHSPCPTPLYRTLPPPGPQPPRAKARLAEQTTSSADTFLYHKTTHRQLYNQLWQEADQQGYLDYIFTNEQGEVSEGAITNLFIERDGIFFTPPLTAGLLPGVLRRYLLESFPEQVKEKRLRPADLNAKGVTLYLGNSVRGLVPVKLGNTP